MGTLTPHRARIMRPKQDRLYEFGTRLRSARQQKGWTAAQLADSLRSHDVTVSGTNVAAWERGQYGPRTVKIVWDLEDLLELSQGELSELLYGFGRPPDDTDPNGYVSRIERLEQRMTAFEIHQDAQERLVQHLRDVIDQLEQILRPSDR